MADIFMWLFAISTSAFSILIVYLFMSYLKPAMESGAWDIIRAKREKKVFVLLDAGSHWMSYIGTGIDEGFIRDKTGDDVIEIAPGSMKYWKGLLCGVGEAYRAKAMNTRVVDFISQALKAGLTVDKIKDMMQDIDIALKDEGDEHEIVEQEQEREQLAGTDTGTEEPQNNEEEPNTEQEQQSDGKERM